MAMVETASYAVSCGICLLQEAYHTLQENSHIVCAVQTSAHWEIYLYNCLSELHWMKLLDNIDSRHPLLSGANILPLLLGHRNYPKAKGEVRERVTKHQGR